MNVLTRQEWAVFMAVAVYSFIPVVGGVFRFVELSGGPNLLPENARALADPWPVIVHIIGSAIFCVGGAVQFLPSIRDRNPSVHRFIGRIVAIAGCGSAASGLWMTWFFAFPEALQGPLLFAVRTVLSIAMIALIGWAVAAIRAGSVLSHRAAMLRAYAIGQGASTQAWVGIGWIVILGSEPSGLARDLFMAGCWALNLWGAETLIRRLNAPAHGSIPARA